MMRIEKFKQLLRERIADYASKYDATKSEMIFGALQEAKDTLEYIEKTFPDISVNCDVEPSKVKVTVEVQRLYPEECSRMRKVGVAKEHDGIIQYDELFVQEEKYMALESFFQFLCAERDNMLKWHEDEKGFMVQMLIIPPQEKLF